jgi:hypothetical protein
MSNVLVGQATRWQETYDPEPGLYCCLHPDCEHAREQVFNGGGGR